MRKDNACKHPTSFPHPSHLPLPNRLPRPTRCTWRAPTLALRDPVCLRELTLAAYQRRHVRAALFRSPRMLRRAAAHFARQGPALLRRSLRPPGLWAAIAFCRSRRSVRLARPHAPRPERGTRAQRREARRRAGKWKHGEVCEGAGGVGTPASTLLLPAGRAPACQPHNPRGRVPTRR